MNDKRELVISLMRQYEKNPNQFTDRQAENIAKMAKALGIYFPKESKPFQKLAFDTADTALLGLIPNKWRPVSRGESIFGESEADKWAGRIGTGLGIVGTGGLALSARGGQVIGKGIGYAYRGANKGAGAVLNVADRATEPLAWMNRRLPEFVSNAGQQANNIRVRARAGLKSNLTATERGKDTYSFFGDMWYRASDPWRQQSLLDQALRTGSSNIRSVY